MHDKDVVDDMYHPLNVFNHISMAGRQRDKVSVIARKNSKNDAVNLYNDGRMNTAIAMALQDVPIIT